MGWHTWDPKEATLVKATDSVIGALVAIVDTAGSILNNLKKVLDIVKHFIFDITDLEAIALKAAIVSARAILDDITNVAGCHFLTIPIRLNVSELEQYPIILDPSPGVAEASAANILTPPIGGGTGGNYGFLKDIVDSLEDEDDILRPILDEDAHVAGVVVVAGSDFYLKLIPVIKKIYKLITGTKKSGAGEGFADLEYPKVTGLTAEIVPAAVGRLRKIYNRLEGTGAAEPYGVRLTWDLPDKTKVIAQDTTRSNLTLTNVHVFRSETPIYTTLESTFGLEIKSFEFDGTVAIFYDDTIEVGKTYYYGVGYEVDAKAEQYDSLSESWTTLIEETFAASLDAVTEIAIPLEPNLFARSGTPPDWTMLPGPLALIPGITDVINDIYAWLDVLESRIDGKRKKFEEYVEELGRQVDRGKTVYQQWKSVLTELSELLDLNAPYLGAFTFSGKGGNDFFVSTLGRSLQDLSDPNRPPFDQGDEVVTGFVLYAGAETAGELQAFQTSLELLFGTGGAVATSFAQHYKDAADTINYVQDQIDREICLLQNLSKTRCSGSTDPLGPAIGPDLEPDTEQNDGTECQS